MNWLIIALFLLTADESVPEITSRELMAHVEYLADDDLQGREAGTDGALQAAAYIAAEFERLGLKPMGDEGTYFQGFSLPRGFEALPGTKLIAMKGRQKAVFELQKDLYPLYCSAAGEVEAGAVFAGYGICAPDLGYDDYDGIDVQGKVVVVMRGVPAGQSRKNPFRTPAAIRRFGAFKAKLDTAAGLGAAALVVVNDPENHSSKREDKLVRRSEEADQGTIPCLHMRYAAASKMLAGTGVSLVKAQKYIDAKLKPRSETMDKLAIKLTAALETKKLMVRNVVGLLEAQAEDKKDEIIVVGAHFDHIGLGRFGSLGGSKAKGKVHNGADDNASGTAGVMEIAGFLKPRASELRRSVLFIAFTAEEMGLLGSRHYVEHPVIPLGKIAAMVNLDMISYLGNTGQLNIYGTGTAPSFEQTLSSLVKKSRVKTKLVEGVGRGASDHYPFYKKSLPALFFITGLHKNYHRPTDDVKYMDKKGFEKVARLAGELAMTLASAQSRPVFTPTTEGALEGGPYLGIAVEDKENGIFIAEVAKGSPAAKSRLREGDQIVEINDREVRTVSVFYGMWSGVAPGEKVTFVLRRSGKLRTVKVRLKK
jgi:hypothetical protein